MAVLGINESPEGDWARLRGLQYSSLARVTATRILAHGIAALAVLRLYYGVVHIAGLIAWLAVLGGSLYYGSTIDKALGDADRRRITRAEVNRQTMSSIGNALVWVVPMAAFAPSSSNATRWSNKAT